MWNTKNPPLFLPTEGEYKILRALWKRGPSTVSEIQTLCSEEHPMGYTTALKFLQILLAKKAVIRERRGRRDIYQVAVKYEEVNRTLALKHLALLYDGVAMEWVRSALKYKWIKTKDLQRLIKPRKKVKKRKK
ncbi:MAG: BlaI/MecI/CopY family transcriptional regulator [Holophagaceae bacterium]